MRKINEIFYSLQGEGAHSGVPSVFVRFSGCNLKCSFCDTTHESGTYMTDDAIAEKVSSYPADWIVLTGGEPTLWIDDDFIAFLKKSTGKKIAIETNGSRPVPNGIDWVTVSPKVGMDGAGCYDLYVTHADEIKIVDIGQDLNQYFNLKCKNPSTKMYLQPCYVADTEKRRSMRNATVARVLEDPRWSLSLQVHRFLGIP